ncbi:hypothetical protein BCR43DRAFT_475613 [Syncephalastrum racemosum]|uniref:Fusaric acid resistance protein-like-domain-containing protein n=1 Tax=Syncephalastrum racemosum TaxID=13706 RepID=A0A1X2HAJ5_SYNRA|nr:hypothetical protein BCR43DRAFT_475613 [Syncephalastrum racemosum]
MEDINLERKESEAFSSQTDGDPADDTSHLYNRRKSKTESPSSASVGEKPEKHDSPTTKQDPSKARGWLNALRPPPFAQMRKTIKVSIALLIALIMTLDDRCREAIGSGALLVCIVLVFYFPSRTVGVVLEDVIIGTVGALLGAAWSFLGMYLANLARDKSNPSPVQPKSSAVFAFFLFIASFVLTYFRIKFARANFACINASILVAFTMTQGSIINAFAPTMIWTFLTPIALGGAIALGVSAFIWPDDSISNYMAVLNKTLSGYNDFFKEHTHAMLETSPDSLNTTLPSLHEHLQSSILLLIDCKRAVRREILFSRLNGEDISRLTKITKTLRSPLHGVGLSWILKKELLTKTPDTFDEAPEALQNDKAELRAGIQEIHAAYEQISHTCHQAMNECLERLKPFSGSAGRTTLNSILWPFPRLFSSAWFKSKDTPDNGRSHTTAQRLEEAIQKLDKQAGDVAYNLIEKHHDNNELEKLKPAHHGLYIMMLYRYSMREYTHCVASLLEFVEDIETTRRSKRFWFPRFRKLFRSSTDIDPNIGGDTGEYGQDGAMMHDLTLVRTSTRNGDLLENDDGGERSAFVKASGRLYYRDPDVDPPSTPFQNFCYSFYKLTNWFLEVDTFFSFKTAVGVVMLAVPAYLAESVTWYFTWRGQWAMITLMLWMYPMNGMFFYSTLMRVLGTVLGGVLGIVIWEMTTGNPYGIAVVFFAVFLLIYHIFLTKPPLRMLAIMVMITSLLVVIYEHNYVVTHDPSAEPVWTVAGKRMLLVIIGIAACTVLSVFPAPVTGRVELRRRLARTLRDLGRLYGVLTAHFITPSLSDKHATKEQIKAFRKLALTIQRQIGDERTFLKLAVFEPPLRGKFPAAKYQILVDKVENMADLVVLMAETLRKVEIRQQKRIALTVTRERRDYIGSVMTTLKMMATTLAAKMSMPPYMMTPAEARGRYLEELRRNLNARPEDLNSPSMLALGTYLAASTTFTSELQALLDTVEELVGVEDPEEWLRLHV